MKRNQKVGAARVQKEKFARVVFPVVVPKNESQKKYAEALRVNTLVVAQGSAGTGKTYQVTYHAAKKLHYGDIKKIVLIRAYQPLAGRTTGFLPGDIQMKLLPFYQQMIDYLEDCLGKASVEIALKSGTIEICSLETIRGRSWSDAIVIVDEAQNLYPAEIQALVTRIGENCQMVLCGDNAQNDQKAGQMTGLQYLEKVAGKYRIDDSAFITFTRDDVVRSGMVKDFVLAFDTEATLSKNGKDIINLSKKGNA
jgi:phosphate starvation-inducible PhoH-like protein